MSANSDIDIVSDTSIQLFVRDCELINLTYFYESRESTQIESGRAWELRNLESYTELDGFMHYSINFSKTVHYFLMKLGLFK